MNKKDIENLNLLSEGVLGNVAKRVAKGAAALGNGAYNAATSNVAKKGYAAAGKGLAAAGRGAANVAGAAGETLKHYGQKAAGVAKQGLAGAAGYATGDKQKAIDSMNFVKLQNHAKELENILKAFEVDITKSGADLSNNQEYLLIRQSVVDLLNIMRFKSQQPQQ